jgi:hypothetical protein
LTTAIKGLGRARQSSAARYSDKSEQNIQPNLVKITPARICKTRKERKLFYPRRTLTSPANHQPGAQVYIGKPPENKNPHPTHNYFKLLHKEPHFTRVQKVVE